MIEGTEKITETEDVTTKKKWKVIIAICVVLTVLAAASVSLTFYVDYQHKYIKKQELINTTLSENLEKSRTELLTSTEDNKQLISDLEKLNKRLEGIKDQDDLLRRDIELYIDQKFKLIPKVLCKDISNNIVKFSKEQDVSPELVVGIIQVESSFNPSAVSKKGALGLMQVMPEWAKKFKIIDVNDLHDVDTNISAGIKVLKIHIKDDGKGNVTKGLYYYVGKDKTYADNVFKAMGKFVSFRYTVDDGNKNGDDAEEGETEEINEPTANTPPGGSPTERLKGHP